MAIDLHRLAEERSIAYHRVIAARMAVDPNVLEQARRRVHHWLACALTARERWQIWRREGADSDSKA